MEGSSIKIIDEDPDSENAILRERINKYYIGFLYITTMSYNLDSDNVWYLLEVSNDTSDIH